MWEQWKDSFNVRLWNQILGGEKLIQLKTLVSFVPGNKNEKIFSFKTPI